MSEDTIPEIRNCARCGGDHEDLKFKKFEQPVSCRASDCSYEFGGWAVCPELEEPILVSVEETGEHPRGLLPVETNKGRTLYINPEQVTRVEPYGAGSVQLIMSDGESVCLKDPNNERSQEEYLSDVVSDIEDAL